MKTGREYGLGLFVIALGLAYGYGATEFDKPFGGGGPIGPQTFPLLLSGVAVLVGLSLLFSEARAATWPRGQTAIRVGFVFATFSVFATLLQPLGFLLSAFVSTTALVRVMGGGWRIGVIAGALITGSVYILFDMLLGLPLPDGVFSD